MTTDPKGIAMQLDPTTAIDDARFESVLEEARNAFWQKIAEGFPEVTTGDFDPLASQAWDTATEVAVASWLAGNYPRRNFYALIDTLNEALPARYRASWTETGGGCTAILVELDSEFVPSADDDCHLLLTGVGGTLPRDPQDREPQDEFGEDERWLVGVYENGGAGEGEALYTLEQRVFRGTDDDALAKAVALLVAGISR